MDYLVSKGLWQHLEPKPPPQPLPFRYDANEHCLFHQTPGHPIDMCYILKHFIQDLIDEGKVSFGPPPSNHPSNSNIL